MLMLGGTTQISFFLLPHHAVLFSFFFLETRTSSEQEQLSRAPPRDVIADGYAYVLHGSYGISSERAVARLSTRQLREAAGPRSIPIGSKAGVAPGTVFPRVRMWWCECCSMARSETTRAALSALSSVSVDVQNLT